MRSGHGAQVGQVCFEKLQEGVALLSLEAVGLGDADYEHHDLVARVLRVSQCPPPQLLSPRQVERLCASAAAPYHSHGCYMSSTDQESTQRHWLHLSERSACSRCTRIVLVCGQHLWPAAIASEFCQVLCTLNPERTILTQRSVSTPTPREGLKMMILSQ